MATTNSPVGTYAITASLSDPGSKLGNYTVTSNNGTLTVNATPLLGQVENKSRVYGLANPAFTVDPGAERPTPNAGGSPPQPLHRR